MISSVGKILAVAICSGLILPGVNAVAANMGKSGMSSSSAMSNSSAMSSSSMTRDGHDQMMKDCMSKQQMKKMACRWRQ
jgi:pentapeptide MXKDX repeat protein